MHLQLAPNRQTQAVIYLIATYVQWFTYQL
jgi:hypothetical protein